MRTAGRPQPGQAKDKSVRPALLVLILPRGVCGHHDDRRNKEEGGTVNRRHPGLYLRSFCIVHTSGVLIRGSVGETQFLPPPNKKDGLGISCAGPSTTKFPVATRHGRCVSWSRVFLPRHSSGRFSIHANWWFFCLPAGSKRMTCNGMQR